MQNLRKLNLAFLSNRSQEIPGEWTNILVTETLATHHTVSNKEVNTVFVLRGPQGDALDRTFGIYLDTRYSHHYEPEEILGYIYAILHAPSYRKRYAEFLRIDFPRIPFCDTKPQFDALSKLGWELVQVHLLRKLPRLKLGDFNGKGNNAVQAVRYSPAEQAIHINKTQHFAPVPEDVWNFHIGGYQVLDKYLKSRKGRQLSLDEQVHIGRVADALAFTIAQMALIDKAYLAAFPNRG